MNEMLSTLELFWSGLPALPRATGIAIAGWCAALVFRFLSFKILVLLRFDLLSARLGISEFLRKGNVHHSPSRLAGVLVFWLILAITIFNVAAVLDITIVNSLSGELMSILPSLLAALLIVVVGIVFVTFLSNFALTIARNAAMPNAGIMVKAGTYLGNLLVITVALEQIGFGKTIINSLFLMIFGAVAFAAALAFGLGCRDLAKDAMQNFIQAMRERGREKGGSDLEG